MSLINQMLQDLDERRADNARPSKFVRPLPTERHTPWSRVATGVIVAGILVAGVILWLRAGEEAQVVAVAVPTPAVNPPKPVVTPAPMKGSSDAATKAPAGDATQTAPADVTPTPPPMPNSMPRKAETRAPAEVNLKVATALSARGGAPAPDKAKAASATATATTATTVATPPPVTAPPSTVDGPATIEKHVRAPVSSDRAENEYRKAIALLNQGRVGEATTGLRAALREDAKHANARLTLVGVLVEQKQLDEAQSLLQEPLKANPAQPQFALRLARIQVERGDTVAAADTLRKAGTVSGNAEFHGYYAAVLQRLNRHKEAIEEYKTALRLMPQSGVWWMGLGISLESSDRATDAREAFQRARASGSLSPELDRFVDQKLKATE